MLCSWGLVVTMVVSLCVVLWVVVTLGVSISHRMGPFIGGLTLRPPIQILAFITLVWVKVDSCVPSVLWVVRLGARTMSRFTKGLGAGMLTVSMKCGELWFMQSA